MKKSIFEGTVSANVMLLAYMVMTILTFILSNPIQLLIENFSDFSYCKSYLGQCFSLLSFISLFLSPISAVAGLIIYTRKSLLIGARLNYGLLVLAWGGLASSFLPSAQTVMGLAWLYIAVFIIVLGILSLLNLLFLPFWIRNIKLTSGNGATH